MKNLARYGRVFAAVMVISGLGTASGFAADEISPAHLKAAKTAIQALKATETFNDILPNIAQQLKGTLIQGSPNFEALINETVDAKALELAPRRVNLEKIAAETYANAFTETELNEIAAFFNSSTGKKLLKDKSLVDRELYKAANVWASGISRDLADSSDKELQAKTKVDKPAEKPAQKPAQ